MYEVIHICNYADYNIYTSVSCLSFINNSSYAVRPSSSLGLLLKTGTSSLTHILETRICVIDERFHYANDAEKCAIIPECKKSCIKRCKLDVSHKKSARQAKRLNGLECLNLLCLQVLRIRYRLIIYRSVSSSGRRQ